MNLFQTVVEEDEEEGGYWYNYNKYEDVSEVDKPLAQDMTMKEPVLRRVTKAKHLSDTSVKPVDPKIFRNRERYRTHAGSASMAA